MFIDKNARYSVSTLFSFLIPTLFYFTGNTRGKIIFHCNDYNQIYYTLCIIVSRNISAYTFHSACLKNPFWSAGRPFGIIDTVQKFVYFDT